MKLLVVAEEIRVSWPLWAVSISAPPRAHAMFADEGEARAYAKEKAKEYSEVRVFAVAPEQLAPAEPCKDAKP